MKFFLILTLLGGLGLFGLEQTKRIGSSVYASASEDRRSESALAKKGMVRRRLGRTLPSNSPPDVYIPADQRHQGLSRFDLIPFTDRRKGDIDRYRAVNPKYVKRENGRYFYALQVKPETHYFDENLQDQGILPKADVEVDLTEAKIVKNANGKNVKYVRVKDKGYVLSAALVPTPAEIKAGRWFQFPLKRGAHDLYDGTGIVRGRLAADAVRLNYGLQKKIKGETFYYAFSTKLNVGDEIVGASGWIKASAIAAGNDPQFDRNFVEKMQMPTGANDIFTRYEITGGDPQEIIGKEANGAAKYKFGYADKTGVFVAYKVLPKIPLDGKQSIAATDYLKRSDAVINLGFNVAGVSNDTFRVEGANRPLIFQRSSEKDATAVIDLFYPKDGAHTGETPVAQMVFVYGYVSVGGNNRWGWIPLDALKLPSKKQKS